MRWRNLPVFLAYYPSVFAYDAEGQLYQIIAHDYSTHHPLLHTLFPGAFFQLGEKLPGSYSLDMVLPSIVRMFFMAMILGYVLTTLYRNYDPMLSYPMMLCLVRAKRRKYGIIIKIDNNN